MIMKLEEIRIQVVHQVQEDFDQDGECLVY
jgi:hypothetical protein